MATIALIQELHSVLNASSPSQLSGLSLQLYEKFFEVLVEESGHVIQRARSLAEYQAAGYEEKPGLVVCAPIPEIGNAAPGLAELARLREAFPDTPLIVWSSRDEGAIRQAVLEDHGAAAYYTGTLLDAPDDIADMVLEYGVL